MLRLPGFSPAYAQALAEHIRIDISSLDLPNTSLDPPPLPLTARFAVAAWDKRPVALDALGHALDDAIAHARERPNSVTLVDPESMSAG